MGFVAIPEKGCEKGCLTLVEHRLIRLYCLDLIEGAKTS